jgi:hypothetical protein
VFCDETRASRIAMPEYAGSERIAAEDSFVRSQLPAGRDPGGTSLIALGRAIAVVVSG